MSPSPMALRRRPGPPRSPAVSSSSSAGSAAAESGEPGRGAGRDSDSDVEAEAAAGRGAKRPARRHDSPVPKRARPRALGEVGSAGDLGLFEAVKAGRSALELVVDEWLEGYREDRARSFVQLVNFVVRACGCRGEEEPGLGSVVVARLPSPPPPPPPPSPTAFLWAGAVTLEMLGRLQNSEIIEGLTQAFEEDSAEYPLLRNTLTWRRFRTGFCEFIATLVLRAQHNVVYDEYLMDGLVTFLTGLSDSQVRAFRHTSTLAAMKLMTALVGVALNVSLQKNNAQRQYETERAKGLGCWALGKLEGLLEKHKEFQEKQEELETLMNALFKGVFVHRYRDLIPEIRAICIGEMGQWIQHYTASFLTDGYLKYIGWSLHDKHGEVRLRCLLALQGLYCSPETASQMELFTSRFKERIVSMVLDKEQQVATEAVRLLTLILRNMDGELTDADCERVFPLVYASSRPVAAAAGEFLYRKLLAPKGDAREEPGDLHVGSRVFLQLLLVFFIESEFHDHAAYLVDSLWDCASALLKDWPVLTGLLLEESSTEGLGDLRGSSLVSILVASMRQATEGCPPIGRFSGNKVFSARERKVQSEERLRLTQHFVPLLPQLLAKFSADAEKVGPLLEALHYFDLTHYSSGRLEKHLDSLLSQLKEVVGKHTSSEVLERASQALQLLCRTEFAFYSRVDFARSCMMDYLADKFEHEATEFLQSSFSEEEEVYSMATTLRHIAFFHSAHDLTPWRFFEPCVRLLRHLLNTGEACEQVVIPAMTCAHFSLLWELSRCSDGALPDQQQLLSLKDKLAAFCSLCQSCLMDVEPCVQEQAFVLLSDLLLIFGPQLADGGRHPVLQELVYHPEPALQSQMSGFLMDHVFNHSQAQDGDSENGELQVEQLHQRRNLLSGFCKLVVYGVLELSAASDVFKYYTKFYNDYGDIIKVTLNQTRQIDRMEWAHTLLLSLQQLLTQLFLEEGPGATDSATFLEIRDLARRFSLLFGLHQLQNRLALVTLHKDGIKFAFEEMASPRPGLGLINLPFLELLSEFSPRLLPPDKALLLAYLKTQQARFPGSGDEPCWPSLLTYQHSLGSQRGKALRPRKAASGRRDSNGSSEHSGSASLSSRLQTPLLTSTALRAKRQVTGPPLGGESSGSEAEFAQRLHLIEESENSQEWEAS